MFSSPSIRSMVQENSGSVAARKPGTMREMSRKPLLDRSVNTRTPNHTAKFAQKLQYSDVNTEIGGTQKKTPLSKTEEQIMLERPEILNDLSNEDFSNYSTSTIDYEEDFLHICPKRDQLASFNLLKDYCGYGRSSTPPISDGTCVDGRYYEKMLEESFNDSGLSNDELELSSIDEIPLPDLSLDENDFGYDDDY